MTIEQLKHAIRAACHLSGDNEVLIFGSQAILATFPDAPEILLTSIEVDLQPKNNPGAIDKIDGPLGELSSFHALHGFYVHSFPITDTKLPEGWETRLIKVVDDIGDHGFVGWCLHPHDLAASKLATNREKDRDYVRTLLAEGMIDPTVFRNSLESLPIRPDRTASLLDWVDLTVDDLERR